MKTCIVNQFKLYKESIRGLISLIIYYPNRIIFLFDTKEIMYNCTHHEFQ